MIAVTAADTALNSASLNLSYLCKEDSMYVKKTLTESIVSLNKRIRIIHKAIPKQIKYLSLMKPSYILYFGISNTWVKVHEIAKTENSLTSRK